MVIDAPLTLCSALKRATLIVDAHVQDRAVQYITYDTPSAEWEASSQCCTSGRPAGTRTWCRSVKGTARIANENTGDTVQCPIANVPTYLALVNEAGARGGAHLHHLVCKASDHGLLWVLIRKLRELYTRPTHWLPWTPLVLTMEQSVHTCEYWWIGSVSPLPMPMPLILIRASPSFSALFFSFTIAATVGT